VRRQALGKAVLVFAGFGPLRLRLNSTGNDHGRSHALLESQAMEGRSGVCVLRAGAIAPELDGQRSWTIAQETVSMTA
jgi:hypothetical protein